MSTTTDPSTRTLRSVEVAQQVEADSWQLANAIFEDVAELMPDRNVPGHTVSRRVLGTAEDEIHRQMRNANIDISRNYVHDLYVTRHSWPPEERIAQASFSAHYLLRSQDL